MAVNVSRQHGDFFQVHPRAMGLESLAQDRIGRIEPKFHFRVIVNERRLASIGKSQVASSESVPRVISSNGYGQFHMAPAAGDLYDLGRLAFMITGGYPATRFGTRFAAPLRRLDSRRVASLPRSLVFPSWRGELLYQVSQGMWRAGVDRGIQAKLAARSLVVYQRRAEKLLRQVPKGIANIYHYRSGFGGGSVQVARELGMITICDHSIAHPQVLDQLIDGRGPFREPKPGDELSPFWREILADIQLADLIVVNSDFVASTFEQAGHHSNGVRVLYTGPDKAFMESLSVTPSRVTRLRGLRVLVAGTLERRKGIDIVASAIESMQGSDVEFTVVGNWDPECRRERELLLSMPNVRLFPKAERHELARLMRASDVILLPSRAEGSARVVVEGMAAGCVPVVTEATGAPVVNGVNGIVVQPFVKNSIREAILRLQARPSTIDDLATAAEKTALSLTGNQYTRGLNEIYESLLCNV